MAYNQQKTMQESGCAYLVDIIIPVYNTQRSFLECCINSIDLSDPRVHVTVVDDGSDASTARYLDSIAADNPSKLAVFHKTNGGQNSARAYGFQRSRGTYVCFLDSDDWLEWGAFSQVLRLASEREPKILVFDYSEVEGGTVRKQIKGLEGRFTEQQASDYIMRSSTLWATLFRRDAISYDDFCIGPIMGEDITTSIPVLLRAGTIAATEFDAYRYRKHDQSVTRRPDMRAVIDIMAAFDFLLERCDLGLDCNRTTVEWLAILHTLYYAGIRCIEWFGPDQKVKAELFAYMNSKFPQWRGNPHLRTQEIAQAPSFRLIVRGKWKLYAFIQKTVHRSHV